MDSSLQSDTGQKAIYREILSETLATLVLYNTSLGDSITFQTLGKSLQKMGCSLDILVYDNSAKSQPILNSTVWNIEYRHDPSNPGVSRAYNAAYELAKNKQKKRLLLLDQDTAYATSAIETFLDSIKQNPKESLFIPTLTDSRGIVSPLTFRLGGGQRIHNLAPGLHSAHTLKFHNCGIFVTTGAFEQAGGYDEQLPLDFSDFAFVDRLRKIQSTFVVTSVTGIHNLASTSERSLEDRTTRFKSYIKSCRYYQQAYRPGDYLILVRLFFRSLKLSLSYRSFRFIEFYLKH